MDGRNRWGQAEDEVESLLGVGLVPALIQAWEQSYVLAWLDLTEEFADISEVVYCFVAVGVFVAQVYLGIQHHQHIVIIGKFVVS